MGLFSKRPKPAPISAVCCTCGQEDFKRNMRVLASGFFYEHEHCRRERLGVCLCPMCGMGEATCASAARFRAAMNALEREEDAAEGKADKAQPTTTKET